MANKINIDGLNGYKYQNTFHLSIKFVGLALFGSGLIISVQLLGVIGAGIIGLIHRGLSRGKKK